MKTADRLDELLVRHGLQMGLANAGQIVRLARARTTCCGRTGCRRRRCAAERQVARAQRTPERARRATNRFPETEASGFSDA